MSNISSRPSNQLILETRAYNKERKQHIRFMGITTLFGSVVGYAMGRSLGSILFPGLVTSPRVSNFRIPITRSFLGLRMNAHNFLGLVGMVLGSVGTAYVASKHVMLESVLDPSFLKNYGASDSYIEDVRGIHMKVPDKPLEKLHSKFLNLLNGTGTSSEIDKSNIPPQSKSSESLK